MHNLKRQKLLVIAPHPDDETLGCGGLINRVKKSGGKVYVLFMTVGDTKDYSKSGLSTKDQRLDEIKNVSDFFKFDGYEFALAGDEYHLKLDIQPRLKLIGIIEKVLNKIKPNIIAIPHHHDYNQDHVASAQAALAACRPAPLADKHIPGLILGYRSVYTAAWSEPSQTAMNYFVGLDKNDVDTKAKALSLYKSQIRGDSHQRTPEGVKNVARTNGYFAGTEYAEGYYIYKMFAPSN